MVQNNTLGCLLAFLGLAGVACLVHVRSLRAENPGVAPSKKVLARVNGRPIHEDRVKPGVQTGLTRFRKYGMRDEAPDLAKRLEKRALDQVIGEELVSSEP